MLTRKDVQQLYDAHVAEVGKALNRIQEKLKQQKNREEEDRLRKLREQMEAEKKRKEEEERKRLAEEEERRKYDMLVHILVYRCTFKCFI